MQNFLQSLPKFSEIKVEQIESALDKLLAHNLKEIDALLAQSGPFTWENLMAPMESSDDVLNRFWSPIGHLNAVMNNDKLRGVE